MVQKCPLFGGSTVYGNIGNSPQFHFGEQFNEVYPTIGFQCEEHENPADFFLDIINLCERADKNREKQGEQRYTFSLCILLVE